MTKKLWLDGSAAGMISDTVPLGSGSAALSIDTPAPPELVDEFLAAGFDDARFITL